jgi:hypothetical protein
MTRLPEDYRVAACFSAAAAIVFLTCSPWDAPGGPTVAIVGATISGIAAIVFLCLHWIEVNKVD